MCLKDLHWKYCKLSRFLSTKLHNFEVYRTTVFSPLIRWKFLAIFKWMLFTFEFSVGFLIAKHSWSCEWYRIAYCIPTRKWTTFLRSNKYKRRRFTQGTATQIFCFETVFIISLLLALQCCLFSLLLPPSLLSFSHTLSSPSASSFHLSFHRPSA